MENIFDYTELEKRIFSFKRTYPKATVFSIGKSLEGRRLYAIKLGRGSRRIFFNGAHHGMEWMTSLLLMTFAQELAEGMHGSSQFLDNCILYIVPMVNPDGVEIGKTKFWQANARGVDLNHNYDALWQLSKHAERDAGILCPGPTRFSGAFPESEPESRAMADFTRQNNFDLVIAFHSQGQVIYYDFCGNIPGKTPEYIRRFENVSPYRADSPTGIASYGGYKDWFIKEFHRPGFTIEIGVGENPLPMSDFSNIYNKTVPLMLEALK